MNTRLDVSGWLFPLIAVLLMGYSQRLTAQELVMGWEGSSARGYGFLSPMMTMHRGEQISWILRAAASYLYYDSRDATGTTEVRSPGESLGIAVRYAGPKLTFTFGPGYEIRQTRRRPAGGVETNENEHGATFQGDILIQAAPFTTVSLLGSYGQANKYYWVRGGIRQQISNLDQQGDTTLRAGIETTRQGNDDLTSSQVGGVFEIAYPGSGASLQLRCGYLRREDADGTRDSGVYFGVGSYWAY